MPPVIGLTGGIGSGKSEALAAFARRGAAVLSSDEVVHRLYALPEVTRAVAERFGPGVLDTEGAVDRGALRRAALAQEGGIEFLEEVTHPRVRQVRRAWVDRQVARSPRPPLVVCEVPLLYEVGVDGEFDAVLVVTASEGLRRARVKERNQDFDAIASRQLPEQEKVVRASSYFQNDGDLEALDAWVASCFTEYAVPAD
jgi:dephospho-CoA kinase